MSLFMNWMRDIEAQLQITDAGLSLMEKRLKNTPVKTTISTRLQLNHERYPNLSIPIQQSTATINRAHRNNYEFAFHRLYSCFAEYCKGILGELFNDNPLLVAGKAPVNLQYHEIIQLGNYDNIKTTIINAVFKKLEGEKSTTKMIQKLIQGSSISLPDEMLHDAMAYIELRHLIVHNASRIDQSFLDRFPKTLRVPSNDGSNISLSLGFTRRALSAVSLLVAEIDRQLPINKTNASEDESY